MLPYGVFSIGHSNLTAERFLTILQAAGVKTVADVRSTPFSRFCPWFSQKPLAATLAAVGIGYIAMGDTLGGRPRDDTLYRDGVADYEAMALVPEYVTGIERLIAAAERTRPCLSRPCLMCAEREPLDCHRCLLVTRRLAERGVTVGHILHDGSIEAHAETEQRLLALDEKNDPHACDLFATGQDERLAAAYRRRARTVGFRRKHPGMLRGVDTAER
jgi:uncharacterized protein (DUF488 family)